MFKKTKQGVREFFDIILDSINSQRINLQNIFKEELIRLKKGFAEDTEFQVNRMIGAHKIYTSKLIKLIEKQHEEQIKALGEIADRVQKVVRK